jgi:hypothetical protein
MQETEWELDPEGKILAITEQLEVKLIVEETGETMTTISLPPEVFNPIFVGKTLDQFQEMIIQAIKDGLKAEELKKNEQ